MRAVAVRVRETQQIFYRLPSGSMAATVKWAVDEERACDVLRGYIEYRPQSRPGCDCSRIGFIQVAKAEGNDGRDYDWSGVEQRRNLLRTSQQMGADILNGYFVDHRASACGSAPCSPYFRDHWANPAESGDGFQTARATAPASLVDYPFGWDTLQAISLESCARCVDTGEFLGCALWGARWPIEGARSIAPIRVEKTPSATFLAALDEFERFYNSKAPFQGPILRALEAR